MLEERAGNIPQRTGRVTSVTVRALLCDPFILTPNPDEWCSL